MAAVMTRFLPPGASPDASRLVAGRGIRGFADGMVSVLLASYLTDLGFSPGEVGVLITGTLLGSAALTLGSGLWGGRFTQKQVLLVACGLMLLTGVGFASVTSFWPLLLVAIAGTLNPSGGDVSVFLPTEQSLLTETIDSRRRTALFARYTLTGTFAAAVGALCAGLPLVVARWQGIDLLDAQRAGFLIYAVVAVAVWLLYRGLSVPPRPVVRPKAPLEKSRAVVLKLSAVFSLDSLGGGFVVQSLLALWLFEKFELSLAAAGVFFFWSGVLSAFSFPVAAWLSRHIGLVNTMVFTHIPSSLCLMLAAIAPTLSIALAFLLLRAALSQMDVPTRSSYVMALVTEAERAAAASLTSVPRSLAAAASPALAGALFSASLRAAPLVICGVLKITYDLLLLLHFRHVKPPEER